MKKRLTQVAAIALAGCMLAGCAGSGNKTKETLNPADYETDKKFITIVDSTPNVESEAEMKLYTDAGFNTFILTEDYVPMTENGKLSDSYKKAIEKLGDMGLNVWIRNMWNDGDYFDLDKAKSGSNYGSPYTMQPRKITSEFDAFPEVTGFYMADELYKETLKDNPDTEADESLYCSMDKMDKLIEWKNTYYPDKFWHINHVPSSSYDHWEDGDYASFIQHYVDTILRKLKSGGRSISMDHYPLTQSDAVDTNYLCDILTLGNIARDYNASVSEDQKAEFCICLQTFQNQSELSLELYHTRDVESVQDITFQMYTGMACGTTMFEYFCWRTYDALGMYGIVDETGQKRIYDYVKGANELALPFEKVVLAFDWQGLTVKKGELSGKDDVFGEVDGMTIEDTGVLQSIDSRYDAIVGCFKKDGQDGYMAVNFTNPALKRTNAVTMNFKGCTQALVYTEEGTEQVNLTKDGDLRLILKEGQAAFVIPK